MINLDITEEELIQYGELLYNQFAENKDVKFIICPCSIGDTVNILAFADEYKKIYGIQKLIVIIKEAHESLIKLFHGIAYFTINDMEMWALRFYIASSGKYDCGNILYGHFPPKSLDFLEYESSKELSFVHGFLSDILRIPFDSKPQKVSFDNISSERKRALEIEYENAVIICPHAKSYAMFRDKFWEMFVAKLTMNGETKVYINSKDKAITGTKLSNLSIDEMVYAASIAKCVIGIRSGIFDILALSDARLYVITPNIIKNPEISFRLPKNVHLYFDLRHLNEDVNVVDYSFCDDVNIANKLIDTILEDVISN